MLRVESKIIVISFLLIASFFSTYQMIMQTHDHRNTFANLESIRLEKEELSFQSNILIEEVKYFKNQISMRRFASDNLGMIIPSDTDRNYIVRSLQK